VWQLLGGANVLPKHSRRGGRLQPASCRRSGRTPERCESGTKAVLPWPRGLGGSAVRAQSKLDPSAAPRQAAPRLRSGDASAKLEHRAETCPAVSCAPQHVRRHRRRPMLPPPRFLG
jgi:hypothetical protein